MRTTQANQGPIHPAVGFSGQWARDERGAPLRDARHPKRAHQWLAAGVGVTAVLIGCVAQHRLTSAAAEARQQAAAAVAVAEAPPSAPTAAAALIAGYVDLAFAAFERDAYGLARFYAERSIAVGALAPLALATGPSKDAAAARADLKALLGRKSAVVAPAPLASAQSHLDCWLREALPGGLEARRARCRNAASLALEGLLGDRRERGGAGLSASLEAALVRRRELEAVLERWSPSLAADGGPTPLAAMMRATDDTLVVAPSPVSRAAPWPLTPMGLAGDAIETDDAPARVLAAAAPRAAAGAPEPAPAAAPALTSVTLYFESGSAEVDAAALETALTQLALRTEEGRLRRIRLTGHADADGGRDANLALSKRRALATAEALQAALGLDLAQIEIKAYGEMKPRIQTADGVQERRNRRVEIALL